MDARQENDISMIGLSSPTALKGFLDAAPDHFMVRFSREARS
jgi:hypothetical protein